MKYAIVFVSVTIVIYGLWAFSEMTLDASKWTTDSRVGLSVMWVMFQMIGAGFTRYLEEVKEEKSNKNRNNEN